jgi:hypothetical protein
MANTISRTISDDQLNRIVQIESAGNPNAKAPTSSAAGLGQFITGTWLGVVQKHKPGLFRTNTREQIIAMRVGAATAALQLEMLARFTEDNAAMLGAGFTDGDLYLAHFLGISDARKLFRAPPGDLASNHVTAGAVAANRSILSNKTCGQVRAWAQASMLNRWVKAGKTDWVKKWSGVQTIPPPDVPAPVSPPKTPNNTAGGVGGAVVVGGGAVIATHSQSASTMDIAIIFGCTALIAVAVFFIIRNWRKS